MSPKPAVCLNCGAELGGPFCSRCGQRAVSAYPTIHELWVPTLCSSSQRVYGERWVPVVLKTSGIAVCNLFAGLIGLPAAFAIAALA